MVGGGQLARMTHQAAIGLDVEFVVLAESPDDPVAQVSPRIVLGSPDREGLRALGERCDVVTFDHEGVEPELLEELHAAGHPVRPGPFTLRYAVDKLAQRRHLASAGLAVPAFAEVSPGDLDPVERLAAEHGWPLVLKAPTGGYDGRGVWMVDGPDAARRLLAEVDRSMLVEEAVAIEREIAVVIARRPGGEQAMYPAVRTVQRDGICHEVVAPAGLAADVESRALHLAHAVADAVDAVGILAVELFVTTGGDVVVNEIAARPHNSAHFTIEGAQTSQFENHLRAVLDWPLGPTELTAPSVVMANIIAADETTDPAARLPEALASGTVHVHLYGKSARSGRKIGHVTALAETPSEAFDLAAGAARLLSAPGRGSR